MPQNFVPPQGGYEDLLSFRKARIVYDATVRICERFLENETEHVTRWCRPRVLVNKTQSKEAGPPEHPRKLKPN